MTVKRWVDLLINDADMFMVKEENYWGKIFKVNKTEIYDFINGYEDEEVFSIHYNKHDDKTIVEIIYRIEK